MDEPANTVTNEPIWAEPVEHVLAKLQVQADVGLDPPQFSKRLDRYGLNVLAQHKAVSIWHLLIKQFKSLIMLLLIVASCLALWFGDHAGAIAILFVIVINTTIAFTTELSAVKAMAALSSLGQVTARVLRGGESHQVPADQLVPGDILVIDAGAVCPADCRIITANKLQVDESSLTGESAPVQKTSECIAPDSILATRKSMLYRGTSITNGTGTAVITATGKQTEIGSIASLVAQVKDKPTPLEQKLQTLAHKLIWVTLCITATVTLIGTLAGKAPGLMIETGIALAIAAIPEGLPVVATIALARGMSRMARNNALISRLASVETLGSTGVICTDKTGTLTENQMTAVRLVLHDKQYSLGTDKVTNVESDFPLLQRESLTKSATDALEIAVLCNNAELTSDAPEHETGSPAYHGDPLEVALLHAGAEVGIVRAALIAREPEVREEAFDANCRMMATVHKVDSGYRIAVKGAPEEVIAASTMTRCECSAKPMDALAQEHWLSANEQMAAKGLRVIAIAEKYESTDSGNVYDKLTMVGLIGLHDPPRRDIRDAIKQCQSAGIKIVMMTGDQKETAKQIGKAVSLLEDADDVVHGSQLDSVNQLSQSEKEKILATRAFARVSPQQKLELIDLHQQAGQIVAMTGDGVNDAPALEKADIGVAMGQRGTQVARESSEMVLQDDSFSTIVIAIREGRVIFSNIRLFALYLLSCNVSEVMIVGLAAAFGGALPLLPLQILFLNLVTDVFPALALGLGTGSRGVMSANPRPASEPLLGRREWLFIVVHGAIITSSVLGAFWIGLTIMDLTGDAAVTVSFLTLALTQLWHVFNLRVIGSRLLNNQIAKNHFVWLALIVCGVILFVSFVVPALATVLHLTNIGWRGWLLVISFSLIPTVLGQLMIFLRLPFCVRESV